MLGIDIEVSRNFTKLSKYFNSQPTHDWSLIRRCFSYLYSKGGGGWQDVLWCLIVGQALNNIDLSPCGRFQSREHRPDHYCTTPLVTLNGTQGPYSRGHPVAHTEGISNWQQINSDYFLFSAPGARPRKGWIFTANLL